MSWNNYVSILVTGHIWLVGSFHGAIIMLIFNWWKEEFSDDKTFQTEVRK